MSLPLRPDGSPLQFRYVETVEDAGAFLDWVRQRRFIIAIDTETTGLDWWTPHFVRLVQFGDVETSWSVSAARWRGVIEQALEYLRDSKQPVAMHNAMFDMHALEDDGYPLPDRRFVHDTLVMDHLIESDADHSLKGMMTRRFGKEASYGQSLLKIEWANTQTDWATIDDRNVVYWAYAGLDTILTAWAAIEKRKLMAPYREAYDREMAYMWIMYDVEKRGMHIDPIHAMQLRNDWMIRAGTLADSLIADGIKNPNSNKQVSDALELAGWEPDEFTPKGAIKLDKAILLQLQEYFPGDIAERLLEYKRLVKWSTAYLEPFANSGGRIHPNIRTLGARTGRSSVSGPPIQQLPSRDVGAYLIRKGVLPEEGDVLYSADYDGQELRMHAHYSNSTQMIQAFADGVDPHTFTASLAYQVAIADVTKAQRAPAKNTRYAKLYGAGNAKIAKTAGVPVEVINGMVEAIDRQFPEERVFNDTLERKARERWADEGRPYVMSWGGRKIMGDGDKLYALLNYLIQGSAADILKAKTVELNAAGLSDHIVIPVHDELLFSFPRDEAADMAHEAVGIMEEREAFKVPLTVDASGPYETWGDKYKDA